MPIEILSEWSLVLTFTVIPLIANSQPVVKIAVLLNLFVVRFIRTPFLFLIKSFKSILI